MYNNQQPDKNMPYSNPLEREVQLKWAKKLKGEIEIECEVGYIDILTNTHAYEVKSFKKWKNAIGQAIAYSHVVNKKPGVILYNCNFYHDYYDIIKSICNKWRIDLILVYKKKG